MSDSDQLKTLDNFTYVIFIENKEDAHYFTEHTDENTTIVDVSLFSSLKEAISAKYKIERYPAMIYRGGVVYKDEDVEGKLDQIDKENIEKYSNFLNNFLLKKGVTVFIKGTLENPYCKYTKQLISAFNEFGIKNVKDFDIFTDDNLRFYLKKINNWQTFPMVFVNANFVGGLDTSRELLASGKFQEMMMN